MYFSRNILTTLLSWIFIINIHASVEHSFIESATVNIHQIEQVLTQHQQEFSIIDFSNVSVSLSQHKTLPLRLENQTFCYQIKNHNSLEELKINTQNHIVLNVRSKFLQIVTNEISIQRSHYI